MGIFTRPCFIHHGVSPTYYNTRAFSKKIPEPPPDHLFVRARIKKIQFDFGLEKHTALKRFNLTGHNEWMGGGIRFSP
jgi:hypothetical protein